MTGIPTGEAARLRDLLRAADRSRDQEWLRGLPERKRAELTFHDEDRPAATCASVPLERQTGNKKFYSTVARSREYVDSWIAEHTRGRVFLDYACGNGAHTIAAARAGAALAVGLDISGVSIENCRRRAVEEDVSSNTYFVQGDCEDTGLPGGSFDTVICSGMLHHLDLSRAFPELRRIMKPGGRCLAVEALNYNPVIKLYRFLTPDMRTDWEKRHILSHKHLRFARWFFDVRNIRYWHLASIGATPFRHTPLFSTALAVGNGLDAVLLRIPLISLMAWMFTFELVRPAGE